MRILNKSLLHSVILFIIVFFISAMIILYFSPLEAESISEISYDSFWFGLSFSVFMFFSIYFILDNKENKKTFWKRFVILVFVVAAISIILFIISYVNSTQAESRAFAFVFFIEVPAIFLFISFILTLLYRLMLNYSEKLTWYILIITIILLIFAIIINIIMHGGCLSGDVNCLNKNIIEKGDISLCDGSISCVRQFIAGKNDETLCDSLVDYKDKGVYPRSICYSEFAQKKKEASLCKFDDWTREGCCSIVFGVDLYDEGLTDEQKSMCGIA